MRNKMMKINMSKAELIGNQQIKDSAFESRQPEDAAQVPNA